MPLVFLHADYQPSSTVSLGGSDATLYLSDSRCSRSAPIGAVAGSGSASRRSAPRGRAIWISSAVFLAFVLRGTAVGAATPTATRSSRTLLTAAKFAEYALLALAAPLAIRGAQELTPLLVVAHRVERRRDVRRAPAVPRVWNEFEGRRPGQREPSFLGIHDLAALSGATLVARPDRDRARRYRRQRLGVVAVSPAGSA